MADIGAFNTLPFPMQVMLFRRMQDEEQLRRGTQMDQQRARVQAGQVLYDQFSGQQQPNLLPAPPMGQGGGSFAPPMQAPQQAPAPPPGTLSPGGGNPMAQGGPMPAPPPMGAPQPQPAPSAGAGPSAAPPMPPRGIAPFQPMPSAPPRAAALGEVPPPPMGGGAAGEPAGPKPLDIGGIVMGLKRAGVAPDQVMNVLETLTPTMNAQNKAELDQMRMMNSVQNTLLRTAEAEIAGWRARTSAAGEERRGIQGDARIDIARDRESRLSTQRVQLGGPMGLTLGAIEDGAAFLILNGRLPMGLARQGPEATQAIQNKAAEMVRQAGLTPQEFAAAGPITRQKLGAYLQLEKNRNAIQAYESMLDLNIDVLKELSGKVSRTGSPYVNKPVLWLQQNASGDPGVAEYLFQVQTVSTEIARVLNNPNLTGQLTDTARNELQQVVRGELNPQQMDRVLARAQADARNRSKSFDRQADKLIKEIKDPLHRSNPADDAPPPPGARARAPQAAIDYLKKHPETAAQFSAKYGYLPPGVRRAP